ncbi:MAG: J domain-containing protein [Candidatus Kapabacteria bacterium]|nr:J domain-containing protein [Candidatus Kapabacteria bacterium]
MSSGIALVPHPAVQFYRIAIAQLQRELRDILSSWFSLTMEIRPHLLERYASLFGELEWTLQVETLRAAQVQRVCELVEAYRRRGEAITEKLLERICQWVAHEFRRYRPEEPHQATRSRPQEGNRSGSSSWPTEETQLRSRLCAQLYRELVKRLHPDREGDTDLFKRYWTIVQEAYQHGQLDRLRAVHAIVCMEKQYRPDDGAPPEVLARVHRRLLFRLDYERRRLVRLGQEEPFIFAEALDDPTWIAQRRTHLLEQIERQRRGAALARQQLQQWGVGQWEDYLQQARAEQAEQYTDELFQQEFMRQAYFSARMQR